MSFTKIRDGVQVRNRVTLDTGTETIVEQSHKAEVDINNIVKRAGNAELIAKVSQMQNFVYDDVTNNDFQEMMNQMIKAKESFSSVPSELRKKFGNDAAAFMDFVHDKDNEQQLIDWGLANPPEPPVAPIEVAVVSSPETPPETA